MSEHPADEEGEGRPMADKSGGRPGPAKRPQWLVPAVVVLVLVVLGGIVYAVTRNGPSANPPASGSPEPTATATATATTGTATSTPPPPPIPEMTPIKPSVEVTQENDVRVSLVGVDSIQGEARLPGEIAGPAIRVTVRVTNDGSKPLNLNNARVTAYYGTDQTPAGVLTAGSRELTGRLAAGGTADGVYVFTVPEKERGNVRITVDTAAGVPVAVFTGPMG